MPVPRWGLTAAQVAGVLGRPGRARRMWAEVRHAWLEDPLEALRNGALCNDAYLPVCEHTAVSNCGTRKLLIRLEDGHQVECVAIPTWAEDLSRDGGNRTTVCVSTQVGCARGCGFCMTATMGLKRSLSAEEIVVQVIGAASAANCARLPPVRNVVYMGMGEPLDALPAVRQSLAVLTDPHALGLGPRHMTVSTVGTSPQAIRAAADLPALIAWSLHAVDDDLRRQLIPTAKHSVRSLRDAFASIVPEKRHLLVEMTLMEGINDSLEHAQELHDFLAPLERRVRVNLIAMNPGRTEFRPASATRMEQWRAFLLDHGMFCTVRRPRGREAVAACGQLVQVR